MRFVSLFGPCSSVSALWIDSKDAVGSCRQGYEFTTQRGGLLVHSPSEQVEPFLGFCQPLVTSLAHSPPPQTPEVWKQHMIQLHGKAAPKKRSRAPRGGGPKRKREQEELVWDVERMVQEQRQSRHRLVIAGEDDQCVMQYLQLEHQGNVAPAELKVLVDVSAGRGKCSYTTDDLMMVVDVVEIFILTYFV
jgi:hypothetical protein